MAPKNHQRVIIRCNETRFFPFCFFVLIALVTSTSIAVIIVTSSSFGFFLRDTPKCEKFRYGGLGYVDQPPPRSSLDKNNVTNNEKTSSNRPIVSIFQNRSGESDGEQDEEKSDCGYFVTHIPFPIPKLGNQMFSYASFYGTWSKSAKRVGKTTFLQPPRLHEYARMLPDAFEHLSLPYRNYSDDWYEERNFTILSEYGAGGKYWQEKLLENTSCDGRNIMMYGFRQSFKYFSNLPTEEIRREFTFAASVKRSAERLLDRTLAADGKGGRGRGREKRGDCVLVGAHMRRGSDFAHEIGRSFGFRMADEEYLKKAIRFFERIYFTHENKLPQQRSKFWCLTFVILGNDYEWNANASERITTSSRGSNRNNKTRLIAVDNRNSSPAVDLCALSMCDHVIVSTGTFGWWAGFLSGGIVTYNAEYATRGSAYFNGTKTDDYFLPHWIPL